MELVEELLRRLSWEWLLGSALIVILLNQTGFVQRFLRGRSEERVAERDRLSKDQEELVESLQQQLSQEHKWRLEEASFYQDQISDLRKVIADKDTQVQNLSEAAVLSERGNARLRHAIASIFQHIVFLQREIVNRGGEPPIYQGWENMLGITDDIDASIRKLFESVGYKP